MFLNIKELSRSEKEICFKTISPKAIFAIVGDALKKHLSISIIRMGDGESKILSSTKSAKIFTEFDNTHKDWNKRLGIKGMPIDLLRKNILKAGNECTYFAPSLSGISLPDYFLYNFFKPRSIYFDNFFVNEWNTKMIKTLLEAAEGVFIIHRDYEKIITNLKKNYKLNKQVFKGFKKNSWQDNQEAIETAVNSGMQLILFSGGPGAKIIGPEIAKGNNKIVLDIGNTLIPWSIKRVK